MEHLLHALDLAILGDWEGAKENLDDLDDPLVPRLNTLMTEQQRREKLRDQQFALVRHALGNALSVAQANIEAMADGVLEPTSERLTGIRDALQNCGSLLGELKREYPLGMQDNAKIEQFNMCLLIETQARLAATVAESKKVRVTSAVCSGTGMPCVYRGDREGTARAVRYALLGAVRFTSPGGEIRVGCAHPGHDLLLSFHGIPMLPHSDDRAAMLTRLLQTMGEHARVIDDAAASVSFFISLPAAAVAS